MNTKYSLSTLAHRAKTTTVVLSLTGLLGTAFAAAQVPLPDLLEKGIYSEDIRADFESVHGYRFEAK